MVFYADFEFDFDESKSFRNFMIELVGDCWNMMKTPEGFVIYLRSGFEISIEIQYVKGIFIGQSYIVVSFKDESRSDSIISLDSIDMVEIMPDDYKRWGE